MVKKAKPEKRKSAAVPRLPEGVFEVADLVGKLLVIESDGNSGTMRVVGFPVSAGPFNTHEEADRHMADEAVELFDGSDRSSADDLEHWGSDALVVEVKRVVRTVPTMKVGCEIREIAGSWEANNAR